MLSRWWKNLKWLFNHPPVALTSIPLNNGDKCSYCGSTQNLFWFSQEEWGICHDCIKKALDNAMPRS